MAKDTLADIRESEAAFDLHGPQGSVLEEINAMSGYDNGNPDRVASDEDGNGSMPLDRALDLVKFRQLPVWRDIDDLAKSLVADFDAKKDVVKLPAHERTANSDRAEGIRTFLTRVGGMFQEASTRIAGASSEERLRLGSSVQFAGTQPSGKLVPKTSSVLVDPAKVAENTHATVNYFDEEARQARGKK